MYINAQYYEAYREISKWAENLGAVVRWSGYFQCSPKYKLERTYERYFIIYALQGIGVITDENGEKTELHAGDIMMYPPDSYQNVSVDQDEPLIYAGLAFSGEFFDRLLQGSLLAAQQKMTIGVNMELAMEFRNLVGDMIVFPEEQDDYILAKTLKIIAEINQMIRTAYIPKDVNDHSRQCVEKIEAYILKNCREKITLDELAKESGLSKSWINVQFKRVFNISPMQFQMRERLEQAKILLADDSMSIGQISSTLGFSDQFYMSKVFKRHTGMSPTEYRNSLRNK